MIKVKTPSRIHMGLIDLNAELGRIDGGIGLALQKPSVELTVKNSDELVVEGMQRERAREGAERILNALGKKGGAHIKVDKVYDPHIGLGSGTQLMLAVGRAVSLLHHENIPTREIAAIMRRGGTSGIGTAAFETGGFILDGGHSTLEKKDFLPSSASKARPAPLLARYDFPDWKIALVIPKGLNVHGKNEVDVFQRHCPIPIDQVRRMSHLVLMKLLPAVVEADITSFGEAVNEIQGIGFKKIEVGLQSPSVKGILKKCQDASYGAGLSSFGPTIYCVTEDVEAILQSVGKEATVIETNANNVGARIL